MYDIIQLKCSGWDKFSNTSGLSTPSSSPLQEKTPTSCPPTTKGAPESPKLQHFPDRSKVQIYLSVILKCPPYIRWHSTIPIVDTLIDCSLLGNSCPFLKWWMSRILILHPGKRIFFF